MEKERQELLTLGIALRLLEMTTRVVDLETPPNDCYAKASDFLTEAETVLRRRLRDIEAALKVGDDGKAR